MASFLDFFRHSPVRTIPWGPWHLPLKQREDHFLFMGTAGCGKTLSFTQQYAAILRHIMPGSKERALIYDKKGDVLPILCRLKERGLIQAPIYAFNPQGDCAMLGNLR